MLKFVSDCVGWPRQHVAELCDMQERGKEVSYRTFAGRIGRDNVRELAQNLGYGNSGRLTLAKDYAVRFYRSTLYGVTVYYLVHSAIEYVFGPMSFSFERQPEDIQQ